MRKYSKDIADRVIAYIGVKGKKYKFHSDDGWIDFDAKYNNRKKAHYMIFIYEDCYNVTVIPDLPRAHFDYDKVGEYLHRANANNDNGKFEIDYDEGVIFYKTYVNCKDIVLSDAVINDSIVDPLITFEIYISGLYQVIKGKMSPKEAIEEAEKIVDDSKLN